MPFWSVKPQDVLAGDEAVGHRDLGAGEVVVVDVGDGDAGVDGTGVDMALSASVHDALPLARRDLGLLVGVGHAVVQRLRRAGCRRRRSRSR